MEDDWAFYKRRMREEIERSRCEQDESLKALHAYWAGLYDARLAKLRSEYGVRPASEPTQISGANSQSRDRSGAVQPPGRARRADYAPPPDAQCPRAK